MKSRCTGPYETWPHWRIALPRRANRPVRRRTLREQVGLHAAIALGLLLLYFAVAYSCGWLKP
ncbi:MAG TPA: hypothetical protein VNU44_14640 [Bryobacteraceae bacterium]|jgi:hypothetical protein|nr:hypothetical protein [Bryobacteraceae bacterium]